MRLALTEKDNVEDNLMREAEHYIPFDIEDVYLDFQEIQGGAKDAGGSDVMLVAAKKDVVDRYIEMLRAIRLQPVLVDVDAFALENAYEHNYPKSENVVLVNIGASTTNIHILADGVVETARNVAIGGKQLTDRIQRTFNLEFDAAEALKLGRTPPGEMREEIGEIFSSTCAQWALEITKTVDLRRSGHPEKPLAGLLLSGGGAMVAGLPGFLENIIALPAKRFNPFANIVSDTNVIDPEYLETIGPKMAVATGIAIRPSAI